MIKIPKHNPKTLESNNDRTFGKKSIPTKQATPKSVNFKLMVFILCWVKLFWERN